MNKTSQLQSASEYYQYHIDRCVVKEQHLQNIVFEQCRFEHCDFSGSQFSACRFIECEFIHCNLSNTKFSTSSFSDCEFAESKCIGIDWTTLKLPMIVLASPFKFYQCQLDQSNFFELNLPDCVMEQCQIHEADFRGANLSNGSFAYSELTSSLFLHTKLEHTYFTGATQYSIDPNLNALKGAIFSFPDVVGLLNHLDIKITHLP